MADNSSDAKGVSKKKKSKKKATAISLADLFDTNNKQGSQVLMVNKPTGRSGGESAMTAVVMPTSSLTTSSAGTFLDLSEVPTQPPFLAFISNISYDATQDMVERVFADYHVLELQLPRHKITGKMCGYGQIEFGTREDLISALQTGGQRLCERQLRVSIGHKDEMMSRSRQGDHGALSRAGGGADVTFRRGEWANYSVGDRSAQSNGFERGRNYDNRRGYEALGRRGEWATEAEAPVSFSRGQLYVEPKCEPELLQCEPPAERKRIVLAARSAEAASRDVSHTPHNKAIFGEARPVNTARKEREIEQKLTAAADTQLCTERGVYPASAGYPRGGRHEDTGEEAGLAQGLAAVRVSGEAETAPDSAQAESRHTERVPPGGATCSRSVWPQNSSMFHSLPDDIDA